jgi:L-2-hydroxyglutarate oxidase
MAMSREGYSRTAVNARELLDTLSFQGTWRLAARHWRVGLYEAWRSASRKAFLASLRRLIPEVQLRDLRPAPAGVRAQAVAADGSIVDDFVFEETARSIHVLNAPSPAATASLAIGRVLAQKALERL